MLYITVDSMKCMVKNKDADGYMFAVCGGTILPQTSFSLLLLLILTSRLYLKPLQTSSLPSTDEISSFSFLSPKHKLQIVFTSGTVCANVVLFALMDEGPAGDLILTLFVFEWFSSGSQRGGDMGMVGGNSVKDMIRGQRKWSGLSSGLSRRWR